jgi:hypothetical protein
MRKALMLTLTAVALVTPAASRAQVTLGARVGYAFGIGDVFAATGTDPAMGMSEWTKGQIPFQLDGLFRLSEKVAVGAYLAYGIGQAGDSCDYPGADCTARVTRLGAQGTYTFSTGGKFVPWAGVGIGYEWNSIEDAGDKATFKGWEYLNLQLGGDVKLGGKFSAGPYAMVSIGRYADVEVETSGIGLGVEIPDKSVHAWIGLGLRGKFDL